MPNAVSKRLVNSTGAMPAAVNYVMHPLLIEESDRNQITLPNTVSKRVVNSTGASPVLIKQRYG
ncbi:hypothetical protein [Nostoc sp.]|uniref:hypothetical protein n=1 Tax=Nostoc sp. TaxID=1180 RepID=UPI002FF4ACBD